MLHSARLGISAILLFSFPLLISATFSYGSAAAQDPLPACNVLVQCNGEFCADTCADDTLIVDPWLINSIRFQYNLTALRSWRWGPILGTHNGFISRANGFGLTEDLASSLYSRTSTVDSTHVRVPNQRFGPKSLLTLGIRELELDIWDFLCDGINFDVCVCHSPVPDPIQVIDLQQAADKLNLGPLKYNPFRELCSNYTITWALTQVKEWLLQNPSDVAEIFLDNRVAAMNIDLVTAAINVTFGDMLLTPPYLKSMYNGKFPSRTELVRVGKRIIIESNDYLDNNYTGSQFPNFVFWPTTWTDQPSCTDAVPFPNCTLHGDSSWYGNGLPRLLDGGDLAFSPTEEVEKGIVLKPNGLTDLINCGINNIGLADVTPTALAGAVWSWASSEPRQVASSCAAAAMTLVRGQWQNKPCKSLYRAVCRKGDNTLPAGDKPDLWQITNTAVSFTDAPGQCLSEFGSDFIFDVVRDGRENQLIAQRMLFDGTFQRGSGAWMNVQTQ